MSIYTNSIQSLALPKIPLIKESQKEADFAGRWIYWFCCEWHNK